MSKVKAKLRKIAYAIPGAKKIWRGLNRIFDREPDFTGWGMITHTFTPWHDGGGSELARNFLEANQKIVDDVIADKFKLSQFEKDGNEKDVLDSLMWRHYIVYWSALYASKATNCVTKNMVECGVCDGLTAAFAMHAVNDKYEFKSFLYDSWDAMKSEYLLESEKMSAGCYSYLSVDNVSSSRFGHIAQQA